jgi:hypothetical protein
LKVSRVELKEATGSYPLIISKMKPSKENSASSKGRAIPKAEERGFGRMASLAFLSKTVFKI